MKAEFLERQLIDYTLSICGFDEKRNYISLSNIIAEPEELVKQYLQGFTADEKARLKCYKGYCMEQDMKLRIAEALHGVPVSFHNEFGTDDKLFLCHPDLMINGIPADCKSVLKDDWIPQVEQNISKKIRWQMNAQMLMSHTDRCLVIYESRESGLIKVFELKPTRWILDAIAEKIAECRRLLQTQNLAV
jgi:hypothetical protein